MATIFALIMFFLVFLVGMFSIPFDCFIPGCTHKILWHHFIGHQTSEYHIAYDEFAQYEDYEPTKIQD